MAEGMIDRSNLIEKLKLIRNMAENGTPGECNAAKHLLGKLMRKYTSSGQSKEEYLLEQQQAREQGRKKERR